MTSTHTDLRDESLWPIPIALTREIDDAPENSQLLPEFPGQVLWLKDDYWQPGESMPLLTLLVTSELPKKWHGTGVRVTFLVDAALPLGTSDVGPILRCTRDTLREKIAELVHVLVNALSADFVVQHDWTDIEEIFRRDCMLVTSSCGADPRTIAVNAIEKLPYYQGFSAVSPEAVIVAAQHPPEQPPSLVASAIVHRTLRAIVASDCRRLVGFREVPGGNRAFMLASFAIPSLPGQRSLPPRRWR